MSTPATVSSTTRRDERELRDSQFAMRLSLMVGLAMLIAKTTVYFMTHSAAIFSDAAESVVHVVAVGFASFSLRLSSRSASPQFLYGYERITFFSAGFEGAMIVSLQSPSSMNQSGGGSLGYNWSTLEPVCADPDGGSDQCGSRLLSPADRSAHAFAHSRSRWQTRLDR